MTSAIEVQALSRRFGTIRAVHAVSLQIRSGALHGLVGPNGAGKTTTLRCICGLVRPDEGIIRVAGHDAVRRPDEVRRTIGLMPQENCLYGDLSIRENLWFFARLFGLKRPVFDERVERLMHITRLARFMDRRADALSGGMYKKLALSCALLHRPPILILDEPTNGVDPVSRRELWELLYELVADGTTVLIATAYLDEAERCHQVTLLAEGTVVADGEPDRLTEAVRAASFEEAFLTYTRRVRS